MDSTKTITHVGLCAGYGGIELGLKRVIPDLRTIALCEIEAFAIANLVAKMEAGLMDPAPIWPDLKTFPWQSFRDRVDILTGGYPCQPFSSAGKRAGKDDPRHLWPWIADGIASMRPSICFFENVEGHISLGLSNVIEDLGRMGYRTTWGIFSAAEVGAPHQRKRVFILANRNDEGLERWNRSILSERTNERTSWPSRPSIPQHPWEPPRVVGNSNSINRWPSSGGRVDDAEAGPADQAMENTIRSGGEEPSAQPADLSSESSVCDTEKVGESSCQLFNRSGSVTKQRWSAESSNAGKRQTQPSLGLRADESAGALGEALTLSAYGDSVRADESLSEKARARKILLEVWVQASKEAIQWETGGLQRFLAEKILLSGMRLDSFTQRICYFVWCLQTGHQAQGWGLSGMWVYESCWNLSQGQEPIEQLKRELGYALCQLSYEIALERGQTAMEAEGILQGLREASERAWVLSDALPEMEEVWRSTLNQKVWENGCYLEASSKGNRTDELRLCGNGVVPSTAELAFRTLFSSLDADL
jgi:DNA (cytosine-5)-methyltransferase 1